MNWRPIKTAPKDQLVLLSCMENPEYGPYVCVGRWIDVPHTNEILSMFARDGRLNPSIKTLDDLKRIYEINGDWHDGYPDIMQGGNGVEEWRSWEFRGNILFNPTHWMPLPKGVKTREKRA